MLRQQMLGKRRELSSLQIKTSSESITRKLVSWDMIQKAQVCMVFLSMTDEPQMDDLIEWMLREGKTVCVPRLSTKFGLMEAAAVSSLNSLVTGRLGLRMPGAGCLTVEPQFLDIILVPGVAFDLSGARLGMGAGYYDRYLMRASGAALAGIAWGFQIVQELPQEEHDIPVKWLVTEDGIYDCIKGKI